jgi:hypothetical protein
MFGQNIMKPMTKEDAIQISSASKFLVPLSQFRSQLKIKKDLTKIEKFPEDSEVNIEFLTLRLEQQKQEEELANQLMRTTLQDIVKTNKKSKK